MRFAWEIIRKLLILIWIGGFFAGVTHSRNYFEQVNAEANSQAVLLGEICSWHFISYNQKQQGVKRCLGGLVEALYLSWSIVCFSRTRIWSRLGTRMLFHPVQVGLLSDSTPRAEQPFKQKIVMTMRPLWEPWSCCKTMEIVAQGSSNIVCCEIAVHRARADQCTCGVSSQGKELSKGKPLRMELSANNMKGVRVGIKAGFSVQTDPRHNAKKVCSWFCALAKNPSSGNAFRVLCEEGACGQPEEAMEGTPARQTLAGRLQCLQVPCYSEKL